MKGFVTKNVHVIPCTRSLTARNITLPTKACGIAHLSTVAARSHSVLYNNTVESTPDAFNSTIPGSHVLYNSNIKFVETNQLLMHDTLHVSFPREITWLAGAPGAGKGTNSTHITTVRGYKAPPIVMSSLLETAECQRIKDAGGMVDDATAQRALLAELTKPEYRNGVVVDGFPRTEQQAAWLNSLYDSSLSYTKFNFIMLHIEEEASVARQLSRGTAIRKVNFIRNLTGLPLLEERPTDVCENAARTRYQNFVAQYEAITTLCGRFPLSIIDASPPIETVRARLAAALSNLVLPNVSVLRQYFSHPQDMNTTPLKNAAFV